MVVLRYNRGWNKIIKPKERNKIKIKNLNKCQVLQEPYKQTKEVSS